jgi:hypothetical protein
VLPWQVLVSIQSLILVPEPYFNEPGYEQRGNQQQSKEYNKVWPRGCSVGVHHSIAVVAVESAVSAAASSRARSTTRDASGWAQAYAPGVQPQGFQLVCFTAMQLVQRGQLSALLPAAEQGAQNKVQGPGLSGYAAVSKAGGMLWCLQQAQQQQKQQQCLYLHKGCALFTLPGWPPSCLEGLPQLLRLVPNFP